MKRYLLKFRLLWKWLRATIATPFVLSRFVEKFPTCQFYPGAAIDDKSLLGEFNVIFNNVTIHNSEIDDHTFIQRDSIINHASIGKFCSVATRVTVGPGKHPTEYVSSHPAFYSSTQPLAKTYSKTDIFIPFKRTHIGHDVWLGQNALIMDGVNIGTGAVVAAGAVVTKDVPEYAIVAGVPAKIIRFRFDEELRQKILQTKWWDKSDAWFNNNVKLFSDPNEFINLIKE